MNFFKVSLLNLISWTPNLSINGNQKTWLLTCNMEAQTSAQPSYMDMTRGWFFSSKLYMSSQNISQQNHGCEAGPASFIPDSQHPSYLLNSGSVSQCALQGTCLPAAYLAIESRRLQRRFCDSSFGTFLGVLQAHQQIQHQNCFKKKQTCFKMHGSEFKHTTPPPKKIP